MVCNKYICEEVYYKGIVSQNCEDWKIPICSVGSAKGRGNLLQRPRVASCLTLGNELSEETHMLTREKTLLGRGAWAESRRAREPRTALTCGSQPWVLW